MNLLDKLAELKKKYLDGRADTSDVNVIDGWIDQAKRLFLLKSLKDHDGIKYVLEIFQGEVEKINEQLLKADSKKLPDTERDRLLDRRDLAEKYLNIFVPLEQELEECEERVDNEIANL